MGLHPNLTLLLEALGPCGVVLPLEQKVCCCRFASLHLAVQLLLTNVSFQAVLAHSLPLKEAKAGFSLLVLWGRISTRNGKVSTPVTQQRVQLKKQRSHFGALLLLVAPLPLLTQLQGLQDYLIAQGSAKLAPGQPAHSAVRYCFSQDGVKWIDLEGLSEEIAAKAATITGVLSGEPAKAYTIATPGAPPPAEGEVTAPLMTTAHPLLVAQYAPARCVSACILWIWKTMHDGTHLLSGFRHALRLSTPPQAAWCIWSVT